MFNVREYFEGREKNRRAFLQRNVSESFVIKHLAEDWGSRRYFRLIMGDNSRIMMECVPDHTGHASPGHKLSDFIRISRALRNAVLRAPDIFAIDEREGYALLEDFGDLSMYEALEQGEDADVLYREATDILVRIKNNIRQNDLNLPNYYDSHVHKGRQRIVDWYIPATRQAVNPDGLVQSYLSVWDEIERSLPYCPQGFVHGDYHAQNLMRLDDALGILDFQGAMWGPKPYDLANLLEDIRRDVPEDIRTAMIERYDASEAFALWYRVLATQFHCRILGQVLRMAIVGGKPDFLKFIPRVQSYIRKGLEDPVLAPLARWMREENVDLDAQGVFDPEKAVLFIRSDAF